MTQLRAQSYDISTTGFYFESYEKYQAKATMAVNAYGDPVEEFEIQFINGEDIDCVLAKAIGLNQTDVSDFLELSEDWEHWEKVNTIIAVDECGHDFNSQNDPDHYGIDYYCVDSMKELAERFVEDGLFGDIPENLQFYIDYNAITRDLSVDYSITVIAGETYIYRFS